MYFLTARLSRALYDRQKLSLSKFNTDVPFEVGGYEFVIDKNNHLICEGEDLGDAAQVAKDGSQFLAMTLCLKAVKSGYV